MQDTSQSELKQYVINIKGHQFKVSSGYSEDQIREVETFLVQKIDEVAAKSDTYNLMSLTVLVALNLADDILNIRNNKSYITDEVRETLTSLCNSLEKVVNTEPTALTSANTN